MRLIKCILTANDCYKAGRTITPKGVMVHSTGANNPLVARYVQPLEGQKDETQLKAEIGTNRNANDWNNPGLDVCTHAFVGKLADGGVGTVQTLPWNHRGWHAGTGTSGGSANNTHIAFEICEDDLTDQGYFRKVYQEAVELTAMLCKTYDLNPLADGVVICHSEGYQRGVASNHADVMHWFPKFGKSMDTFRTDVSKAMGSGSTDTQETDLTAIAQEVIAGKWGNGTDRAQRLTAAGYDAQAVQNRVNQLLGGGSAPSQPAKPAQKTVEQIAQEVIQGKWGNGADRAQRLTAAGYDAQAVQNRVNQLLSGGSAPAKPPRKTVEQIAQEVIAGKWGNGTDRAQRLAAAGYDAQAVQNKVNQLLG